MFWVYIQPIGAVLKNSRHINFKKYAGKISMAESFSVIIHPKVRWALWKRLQVKFLEQLLLKTSAEEWFLVSNKIPTFCGKYLRVFYHRGVKLEEMGFLTTPSKTFTCLK